MPCLGNGKRNSITGNEYPFISANEFRFMGMNSITGMKSAYFDETGHALSLQIGNEIRPQEIKFHLFRQMNFDLGGNKIQLQEMKFDPHGMN
jgi:hypothetical protein